MRPAASARTTSTPRTYLDTPLCIERSTEPSSAVARRNPNHDARSPPPPHDAGRVSSGRIPDFPEQCVRQRWTVRLGEVEPVFGQTGRVVLDITARTAHDGALKWTRAPSTPRAARSIFATFPSTCALPSGGRWSLSVFPPGLRERMLAAAARFFYSCSTRLSSQCDPTTGRSTAGKSLVCEGRCRSSVVASRASRPILHPHSTGRWTVKLT